MVRTIKSLGTSGVNIYTYMFSKLYRVVCINRDNQIYNSIYFYELTNKMNSLYVPSLLVAIPTIASKFNTNPIIHII